MNQPNYPYMRERLQDMAQDIANVWGANPDDPILGALKSTLIAASRLTRAAEDASPAVSQHTMGYLAAVRRDRI